MLTSFIVSACVGVSASGNYPFVKTQLAPNSINSFSCYNHSVPEEKCYNINSKMLDNLIKTNSFTQLDDGWDGYSAKPISKTLADNIKQIIINLPIQPQIFPTGRNSIQFEYDHNSDYLEIEFFENGMIQIYQEKQSKTLEKTISYDEIISVVNCFYE